MKVPGSVTSRSLLALSAITLATGAAVHALAYTKASAVADHSMLPAFFARALKGLWLSDSVSSLTLAVVLAAIAARPQLAAKSLAMMVGFGPLCLAAVIFTTMGNFIPGYLMLGAGATALLGALLLPRASVIRVAGERRGLEGV